MYNWIVIITADANDDANKVISVEVRVAIDNCPDAQTAAAIAGSHVRRYFGERKVGILKAEANHNV